MKRRNFIQSVLGLFTFLPFVKAAKPTIQGVPITFEPNKPFHPTDLPGLLAFWEPGAIWQSKEPGDHRKASSINRIYVQDTIRMNPSVKGCFFNRVLTKQETRLIENWCMEGNIKAEIHNEPMVWQDICFEYKANNEKS